MTVHFLESAHGARAGHLRLPPGAALSQGLAAAFMDIVSYARAQARQAEAEPVTAVHEYRKAVRRSRAMLRLIRDVIPDQVYRDVAATLRDVHRATSSLRDRHVVLVTLDALPFDTGQAELTGELRERIAAAALVDPQAVTAALHAGAERLEPLPGALADALPDRVRWSELRDGLRVTYARAQERMYDTFHHGHDEPIHDWRKRTKELHHQLELLVSMVASGKVRVLRRRLSTLTHDLGRVVDLMVLDQYVREHATAEQQERLGSRIAAERAQALAAALDQGQELLEPGPRRFAREIVAATRRAHDMARKSHERAR